jgi:hypothetical protein
MLIMFLEIKSSLWEAQDLMTSSLEYILSINCLRL